MARLAISKGFLAEYVKLGKDLQRAVDQAIAAFARDSQPASHLEKPEHGHDDRIGIMPVNGHWRGVVLTPGDTSPEDTYSLVTVLPRDQVDAYVTNYLFTISQPLQVLEVRSDEASPQEAGPEEASPQEAGPEEASPAVGLLTAEAAPQPAPPEVPEAASAEAPEPDGQLTSGPAAPGPDDQLTAASELEKAQHGLAHPFAAWRTRRRARRLGGDGTRLTEEHASASFGPDRESST